MRKKLIKEGLNLGERLMINTNFLDKTALVTKEKSFTYHELFQKIDYYAEKYFSNNSYSKVAIYAENRADWIFAF